jgi:hypothetical protein
VSTARDKALEAWDARINDGGGDAVHDLYLWVTHERVHD